MACALDTEDEGICSSFGTFRGTSPCPGPGDLDFEEAEFEAVDEVSDEDSETRLRFFLRSVFPEDSFSLDSFSLSFLLLSVDLDGDDLEDLGFFFSSKGEGIGVVVDSG